MTGAATSYRRGAWYAVWSPLVAWGLAVSALAVAGGLGFDPGTTSFVVGLVLGWCAFVGLFVAVGRATGSLLGSLETAPDVTPREQTRLSLLSLLGVSVSLIGYGGLVVLCGFIVLMAPFHGIRH
ncbi:MAG TPA: hypothetical protein VGE74_01045 [Gemmata sp.]